MQRASRAAAGREEELSERGGFPCSTADVLMCERPHATLLGGQCYYPAL